MSDPENQSLIEFPCDFPIKIMGKTHDDLFVLVNAVFKLHVADFNEKQVKIRPSGKGNYSAITVTIQAQDQAQLDAIYQALSDSKLVLMAL